MRTDQPAYRLFNAEECTFLERMFVDHPNIGQSFDAFLALPPSDRYSRAFDLVNAMPRSGWVRRQVKNPETVYDHLCDVARMAQTCSLPTDLQGLTEKDARKKLVVMATLHDIPEAIVTDFTPHCAIAPKDKDRLELLAGYVIYESDPHGLVRLQEYIEQITPLSHTLHDLDKLSAVHKALEYEGIYPEKRGKLYTEFRDYALPILKTEVGRELAAGIEANAESIREGGRQKFLQQRFAGREF